MFSLSGSENTIRGLKSSLSVVAAFQAEGFPSPPSGIASMVADFVRSATQGIPFDQLANMAPGTGSLATAASAAVNLVVGGMTQEQKEAMKAGANPFDAAAVHRFSEMLTKFGSHAVAMGMMTGGGGGDKAEKSASLSSSASGRVTSSSYTQELAGGATCKALVDQGYKPAHIHDAMEFARHIGASQDMAQKFIKMDQASRDNLHRFVDDMRKNPAKTPEEEKAKIEEFRKAHPEAAKHLTPEDIRKILHSQDKKALELKGGQLPFTESQKDRIEANKKFGGEKQIEAQHTVAATNLENNSKAAKDDLDVLEAGIKQAEKKEGSKPAPDAVPSAQKKANAEPDKPEIPERHAARPKPDAPKVG